MVEHPAISMVICKCDMSIFKRYCL